jgi:1-deoxy-D-xylulose-5-phosphate synthase
LRKAVYEDDCIAAVRYPRGNEKSSVRTSEPNTSFVHIKKGGSILIVTYGRLCTNAMAAVEILKSKDIACDVLRLVEIFPISEKIADIISSYDVAFFFEEGYDYGSISEKYAAVWDNVTQFTIDYFVKHGDSTVLLDELGFSPEKMAQQIEDFLNDEQT